LNFASALSGYIDTVAGRRLAFAILTADVPRREAAASAKIERPRGARSWGASSRRLQRALVRSWIARFGVASP
ncbi:MAG: D-alanyl-D-alanine carboxypeptidase, partial [Pseudomonadota bacterium]